MHATVEANAVRPESDDLKNTSDRDVIFTPMTLPCGRIIPNRLVKASLYEHLASLRGGPPNAYHHGLYAHWAHGEWGMVLTGNVQVKHDHLSLGRDLLVPELEDNDEAKMRGFKVLAEVIHGKHAGGGGGNGNGTLAIMQLSHAGRQSPTLLGGRSVFKPPLAPSAIPVELKQPRAAGLIANVVSKALFQTPKEMTTEDIDDVIEAFVRGARLAWKNGFDGVEIHAAHGYLVAGFISPQSNTRTDDYSASTNPLHFLHDIVSAIRAPDVVPNDFVLGIKLNAADYVLSSGNSQEVEDDRVLQHVNDIASWKMVDFIEVSGGTYENPAFMTEVNPTQSNTVSKREALFSRFSQRARATLLSPPSTSSTPLPSRPRKHRPLILLTGGLNTPELMSSALTNGHADLLGIGRLSVEFPYLPRTLKHTSNIVSSSTPPSLSDRASEKIECLLKDFWQWIPQNLRPQFPPLIGAGMGMAAYQVAMRRLAVTAIPVRDEDAQAWVEVKPKLVDVLKLWLYAAPGLESRRSPKAIWMFVVWAVMVGVLVQYIAS